MRFLSIGECMVELAPGDAGQMVQGFAGDTFNTLWYLRRLRPDVQCGYHSCVGQDPLSGRFLDMLRAEGIDTDPVHRRSDRTMGLYMIALKDGERSFSYWRETSAARKLAENRGRLRRSMAGADMVYFSGITLAILSEPARLRLFEAVDAGRGQGTRVAFDPNLRPALWRSRPRCGAGSCWGRSAATSCCRPSRTSRAISAMPAPPRRCHAMRLRAWWWSRMAPVRSIGAVAARPGM